ncbi:MAG TPA: hypothetical protein PLB62_14745, partial [Candidatus Sumerlaeota bacterium]|nr:hypothetical protein [Candidatus Sumerlaeota bacterium]
MSAAMNMIHCQKGSIYMVQFSLIAPFPHKFESLFLSSTPGYTLFIFKNSMFIVNIKVQTCQSEGCISRNREMRPFTENLSIFAGQEGEYFRMSK